MADSSPYLTTYDLQRKRRRREMHHMTTNTATALMTNIGQRIFNK